MKQKTNDVNNFWSNFHDAVIRSGIDSSNADWYVKWAKQFAVSIKGRPLRQRTPKDIKEPCSKLQGILDCKEFCHFFDSLANPAASYGECARCCSSTFHM